MDNVYTLTVDRQQLRRQLRTLRAPARTMGERWQEALAVDAALALVTYFDRRPAPSLPAHHATRAGHPRERHYICAECLERWPCSQGEQA